MNYHWNWRIFWEPAPNGTGTYLDMTANLPVVHPEKVLAPVLLVRGEYDGIATVADLQEFYNRLPNGDRQFVILPGTAGPGALEVARRVGLSWPAFEAAILQQTKAGNGLKARPQPQNSCEGPTRRSVYC